jgi:hypothetical protein
MQMSLQGRQHHLSHGGSLQDFAWVPFTRDANRAFLQSQPLTRQTFMQCPPEMGFGSDVVLRIIRGIDGKMDSPFNWTENTVAPQLKALGLQRSPADPCLWFSKDSQENLTGLLLVHMDDFLCTGDLNFTDLLTTHFPFRSSDPQFLRPQPNAPIDWPGVKYLGARYSWNESMTNGILHLELVQLPTTELESLRPIEIPPNVSLADNLSPAALAEYGHVVGVLTSIPGHWPLLGAGLTLACGSDTDRTWEDAETLNTAVQHARDTLWPLVMRPIPTTGSPWAGLTLLTFTDASFQTLPESRSQAGLVYLFTTINPDNSISQSCSPLYAKGQQIHRVVSNVFAAELLASELGSDFQELVTQQWDAITGASLTTALALDMKGLFDSFHGVKGLASKHLLGTIWVMRERIKLGLINHLYRVPREQMVADILSTVRWEKAPLLIKTIVTQGVWNMPQTYEHFSFQEGLNLITKNATFPVSSRALHKKSHRDPYFLEKLVSNPTEAIKWVPPPPPPPPLYMELFMLATTVYIWSYSSWNPCQFFFPPPPPPNSEHHLLKSAGIFHPPGQFFFSNFFFQKGEWDT